MTKNFVVSFVAILCVLFGLALADQCTNPSTWSQSLSPSSSSFKFTHTLGDNVQVIYYTSASDKIEVSTSACSSSAPMFALNNVNGDAALVGQPAITTTTTTTTTTKAPAPGGGGASSSAANPAGGSTASPNNANPNSNAGSTPAASTPSSEKSGQVVPKQDVNAAGRTSFNPITTLLIVAVSSIFVFRRSGVSVAIVLVLLCVVLMPSVTVATSTAPITVRIGLPASINKVCENGVCISRNDGGDVHTYVAFNGDRFAILNGDDKCDESVSMQLPSGWTVASPSDNALAVIAFNDWSCDGVVTADGAVYTNRQYNTISGSNGMSSSTSGCKVSKCNNRILITQRFPVANDEASLLITPLSINSFVTVGGFDYAVADNTPFDYSHQTTQANGIYVGSSSAWQLAPDSDSTLVAIYSQPYSFGAQCLIVSGGNSYNVNTLASCGSNQLVTLSNVTGNVYGVITCTSKSRILLRRTSTSTTDSWAQQQKIHHARSINSIVYATLDNADPSDWSDNGCQAHFQSLPAGYRYATAAELTTFGSVVLSSTWPSTNCFATKDGNTLSRGSKCDMTIMTRTVGSATLYAPSICAKILLVRDNVKQSDFAISMKLLVIATSPVATAGDAPQLALAETMLIATGIPYDKIFLQDATNKVNYPSDLPLLDTDGNPKYYGIIFTVNNPAALTAAQNTQLKNYRFMFSVRTVVLSGSPNTAAGVVVSTSGMSTATACLRFDTAFTTANAAIFTGIKPEVDFEYFTQYYIAAAGSSFVPAVRMVASNTANPVTTDPVVAGVLTNADGTQEFQFFVGNALYFDFGPMFANVWLNWVTKGMWVGSRRVYLWAQVDDLFLATEQYGNEKKTVRMTGVDLQKTRTYFQNLNPTLPTGSHLTLEFGLNAAEMKSPSLELYNAVRQYVTDFYWESHTYSHLNLNCNPLDDCVNVALGTTHHTTYAEAFQDLKLNNDAVVNDLFKDLGGLDTPTYSRNSMITPMITGLFSADALKALVDNGMTCVVGDNSVTALIQANPYQGWWTTKDYNGYEGVYIIPRFPTEIYYNAADETVNVKEYNDRYGPGGTAAAFTTASTLNDILQREAVRNFRSLAIYRHDPYMFHQCNLNHFTTTAYTGKSQEWSLMTLWIQAMVDRYLKFMTLPLLNKKHQDMRDVYLARRDRDFCGLNVTMNVEAGKTTTLSVSSTGSCTAGITGLNSCSGVVGGCTVENYGADTTVWAQMKASVTKSIPTQSSSWN